MAAEERDLIGVSKIARQKVIDRLTDAYVKDYLEQEEFEKRLELANKTRSRETLAELVVDLPVEAARPGEGAPSAESAANINRGQVVPSETIVSILSGATRKGKWYPPRKLRIVAFLGGVELDFTEASLSPGITDINVTCALGGVEMRVPEGVNVDVRCVPIMGGVENHCRNRHSPDAPTIRVTGIVFMGGVEVKPPKKNVFRNFINRLFDDRGGPGKIP